MFLWKSTQTAGSPFPVVRLWGLCGRDVSTQAVGLQGIGGEWPSQLYILSLWSHEPCFLAHGLGPLWCWINRFSLSPSQCQENYLLIFGSSFTHDFFPLALSPISLISPLGQWGFCPGIEWEWQQSGICPERGLCPPTSVVPGLNPHPGWAEIS